VVPSHDAADASAFENVLVAVDLSPSSRAVIDTAMHLVGSGVRQLTAIHAVDSVEATDALRVRARWLVPEYRGYVLGEARRRLKAAMPQRIGTGVKPRLRVTAGAASEAIRAHAAHANADLIVLGRTKRFMDLGSTAVRVLRSTDRALLVVPPMAAVQTIDTEPLTLKRAA
jgi:nucleotide-binding universal stress UspA family protein